MTPDDERKMNETDSRLAKLETIVEERFSQMASSMDTLVQQVSEIAKSSAEINVIRAEHDGLVDRVNLQETHIHNHTVSISSVNEKVADNTTRIAGLYQSNDEIVWLKRMVIGVMFGVIMSLVGYIYVEGQKDDTNSELIKIMKQQTEVIKKLGE